VSKKAQAGWALIALAGVLSIAIVGYEIAVLVGQSSAESSETLPVVGFVPAGDD
jgi:hypothetical protein